MIFGHPMINNSYIIKSKHKYRFWCHISSRADSSLSLFNKMTQCLQFLLFTDMSILWVGRSRKLRMMTVIIRVSSRHWIHTRRYTYNPIGLPSHPSSSLTTLDKPDTKMAAQFVQDALTAIPGVDPRPMQRSQFFSGLNDGPAGTASRIAGLVQKSDAQDNSPYYTSNFGQLLPDSGHPLNVGGIPYQGDPLLLEKQQAFDRSKITERIVHPAGWSAFGHFTVTKDVSHLTRASFLQGIGKKTPTYTRLSTVTYGVSLSPLPNQKSKSQKSRFLSFSSSFWSLLIISESTPTQHVTHGGTRLSSIQRTGTSTSLDWTSQSSSSGESWPKSRISPFSLPSAISLGSSLHRAWFPPLLSSRAQSELSLMTRDPFQGPDNIRSQQRHPQSFLLDFNAWFDFLANVPESQHAGMMLLSDYATPDGNQFSAYGCHTFRWVNKAGEAVFVKVSQSNFFRTWAEADISITGDPTSSLNNSISMKPSVLKVLIPITQRDNCST
jgi:hypothetical protein